MTSWTARTRARLQLVVAHLPRVAAQAPVVAVARRLLLRLSLHPGGLGARIVNAAEWRGHVMERLRRQVTVSADRVLVNLLNELREYRPADSADDTQAPRQDYGGVVVPLTLRTNAGILSFFSTTTIFGTPVDVTLSELAIESFFPADASTAQALRNLQR